MGQYTHIILAVFAVALGEDRVRVRVVGSSRPSVAPTSYKTTVPTAFRLPRDGSSGSSALSSLAGRCFSAIETAGGRSYEYTVCPFANVTQREASSTWNAFYGILGIWDEFSAGDSGGAEGVLYAHFTDGTDCGGKRRSARVALACSGPAGAYALKGVSEPRMCEYELTLACPEACGLNISALRQSIAALPSLSPSPAAESSAAPSPGQAAVLAEETAANADVLLAAEKTSGSVVATVTSLVAVPTAPTPAAVSSDITADSGAVALSVPAPTATGRNGPPPRLDLLLELRSELDRIDESIVKIRSTVNREINSLSLSAGHAVADELQKVASPGPSGPIDIAVINHPSNRGGLRNNDLV